MDIELFFRIIFFIILVLTFSISSYFRKKARDDGEVIQRKEEGTIFIILRMAFAFPLFTALLIYIIYPPLLAWSTVSLVVAALCIPLLWWVFRSIGSNISETILTKRDHQLVTAGTYQWVRHPLYAASLLLLGSLSVIASNWFIFAYFLAALLIFRYLVISAEENRLVEAFGEMYKDYQTKTGALVPRFF